jgi:uncharacterized protein
MREKRRIIRNLLLASVAFIASATALADSRLADLIETGRLAAASELIEAGADVNAAQRDGTTPLHWAAYKLDVELTRLLLDNRARVNVANRFGATPLGEAVKGANREIVSMLLDAGADVESPNLDGQTALMLAATSGSVEVARLLLAHGADVNAREGWREQTALMWAADGAFADLTELLIEHGADVRARAAANDWGAQISSEPRAQYRPTGGLTALLYAARSGCAGCVQAILAAGEDVDRPTPDGVTALMLALDNYEFDTADLLLDAGANPHYADWWGRTALYLAVDMNTYVPRGGMPYTRSSETSAMRIVRRLLASGVAVDTQLNMHRPGRGGNSARFTDALLTTDATPLLRAAIMHDHEAMRALLEHGASVDLPNVMGVTALMAAAGLGVRNIDFGANRSPDFEADEQIEDKVIASLEILLAAGADINARVTDIHSRSARIARPSAMTGREGQTALYSAAGRGWARVVRYLIERGAAVDIVDALGRSPLDEALALVDGQPLPNSEIVAEILRNAGGKAGEATRTPAR